MVMAKSEAQMYGWNTSPAGEHLYVSSHCIICEWKGHFVVIVSLFGPSFGGELWVPGTE